MKHKIFIFYFFALSSNHLLSGQAYSFTSQENGQQIEHRVLMDEEYFVKTQFTSNPNQFIKTLGGFYKKRGNELLVALEFNSNFYKDSLKNIVINNHDQWQKISKSTLPLQGKWLMAGRVKGDQEQRRDITRARKTMKILVDGYFQWIAFNTASFSFHGTGGGSYSAADGTYTESIDYFSRDNNKVGISLGFEYAKKGMDWHHKGFSSKGDPLHEIWTYRTP
tara:strand:+ start:2982 stop:3647 length:666 start_codon:yes stop_codon:yes gene_type:complete